jgi:ribosomal protein S18 acetylase RimI-like enzyme
MAVITQLEPERDAQPVADWLGVYISQHLQWWSESIGERWDHEKIADHLAREDLVARDWQEIVKASTSERCCVRVLRDGASGPPLGIVWSELGRERMLRNKLGVLSWIYVDPQCRGRGYAGQLLDAATQWMVDQGVAARELFVTAANQAALGLYQSRGYRVVDHRMLGAPL